jgi:hypothetical protein
MMTKFVKIFWLLLFFVPALALGEPTIAAEIDKTQGSLEDQFEYTLTVQGGPDSEPTMPTVDGLQIQPAGTSNNISIVNGSMTRTQEYRFVITPERAGTFIIPAITVKFDGKEQSTVPITFRVAEGSASGSAAGGGGQNDGESKEIFVERELSKSSVYEGEQIISKVRLYARVRILEAGMNPAASPEFKRVPVEGEKQYQKVINGETYLVYEVTEILTAQKAGSHKLPPFQFQVKVRQAPKAGQRRGRSVDEFFNNPFFDGGRAVVKNVRTAETNIEVKPLPSDGRPPQFAGLVGRFQLQASLSSPAGKVGDTVTMTAVLSGVGSLDGIPDLKFDPGANLKTYPDKPERVTSIDADRGQIGKITWKFALVPLRAGVQALPQVQVPTFDPATGQYNVLTVQLPELNVDGGAEAGAGAGASTTQAATQPAAQSAVEAIGEDLLPWHDLKSRSVGVISRSHVVLAKWLAIVLMLIVASSWGVAFYKRQDRTSERRASSAAKNFVLSRSTRGDLAAFRNFLGDKLNLHGGALTGAEVVSALNARNIESALVQQVMQSFKSLEASQYSGQSSLTSSPSVEELVRRLDKEI